MHFYDQKKGYVVQEHLAAQKSNLATVANIFRGLDAVMAEKSLKWSSVVSILMDNCNTMRGKGKKGSVEEQMRKVVVKPSSATCVLDPIPTQMFKKCISSLSPVLTKITNIY